MSSPGGHALVESPKNKSYLQAAKYSHGKRETDSQSPNQTVLMPGSDTDNTLNNTAVISDFERNRALVQLSKQPIKKCKVDIRRPKLIRHQPKVQTPPSKP